MTLSIQCAASTDRGRVREKNEDCWRANAALGLFTVADGLGGHAAGEVASRLVVETLPDMTRRNFGIVGRLTGSGAQWRMAGAIAELNRRLRERTRNEPELAGMASTVVCALVREDRLLVTHVGDSRAYRLRARRLRQLTTDHTLVQSLIDAGDLTPEQAFTHPARGRLTQCVGMSGSPRSATRLLTLNADDVILLCTDGLTDMVTDSEIARILTTPTSLETRCGSLIRAANEAGGKDNITALLIWVVEGDGPLRIADQPAVRRTHSSRRG